MFGRRLAGLGLTVSMVLLVIAGCGGSPNGKQSEAPAGPGTTASKEPLKIGWSGGLTGAISEFALESKEGTEFAKEQTNKNGGILGRTLEVLYADTQTDPQKAREAVQRFITSDKVVALDGDYYSPSTLAILSLLEQSKLPTATSNSNATEVTSQGAKYIVRVAASAAYNSSVPVEYGLKKMNLKTWVIFTGTDAYSKSNADAATDYLKNNGGTLLGTESYDRNTTKEFSNLLLKYKDKQPDAIFLAGGPADDALIIKQARGLGIKSQLLGHNSAARAAVWNIGGEAANGMIVVSDFAGQGDNYKDFAEKSTLDFISAWQASHGGKMPSYDHAHGYDTLMLIAKSITSAGNTDGTKIAESMHQQEYHGALGTLKVQPNGAVAIKMFLMKWDNGKMIILDKADAQ